MAVRQFVERTLSIADALARGSLGASKLEAYLLISGLLSGLAAMAWPGDGIDRRRFVELWARFGDPSLAHTRISLPLLVTALRTKKAPEADALERLRPQLFGLGGAARIVTGDEIDIAETDVLNACPAMARSEIRKYAYPSLFYEHIRNSVVHEYQTGHGATDYPMTAQDAGISYGNYLVAGHSVRKIHFHIPWLLALVRSVVDNMESAVPTFPLLAPAWWLFH